MLITPSELLPDCKKTRHEITYSEVVSINLVITRTFHWLLTGLVSNLVDLKLGFRKRYREKGTGVIFHLSRVCMELISPAPFLVELISPAPFLAPFLPFLFVRR